MKHTLLYISILCFLGGCLSGPDTSRINEYDPESPFFSPRISNLSTTTDVDSKSILLNWKDESTNNYGFYIEKRFKNSGEFQFIDSIQTPFYRDFSDKYSLEMEYKVTSYFLKNDNKIGFGKSLMTEPIDFGGLTNIGFFSRDDTIFVQWFRDTSFDDLTLIEFRKINEANWNEIKTIAQADIEESFVRTNFILENGNTYEVRLNVQLQNYSDNYQTIFEKTLRINH